MQKLTKNDKEFDANSDAKFERNTNSNVHASEFASNSSSFFG